jgi:hypothetical protein
MIAPLDEISIETKHFKEPMFFPQFLMELEKHFPAGTKLSLRVDKAAFGKDYKEHFERTPVKLPSYLKKMPLGTVLKLAVSQYPLFDATYNVGPGYIEISNKQGADLTVRYDVGDQVANAKRWQPRLLPASAATAGLLAPPGSETVSDLELLIQVIELNLNSLGPVPSAMTVWNGRKLDVTASSRCHSNIVWLLGALKALADVAVTLESALYAVDQPFYAKQIAPLIADARDKEFPTAALRVSTTLASKVRAHELILHGDKLKVLDGQGAVFLARQQSLCYTVKSVFMPNLNVQVDGLRTILHGFSFHAQVHVSRNSESIHLDLTQTVKELIEVKKTKVLDLDTGKTVVVEAPNLREAKLSATLVVDNGQTILMPVDYQTPEAKTKNRILVLLLTARVWEEAEQNAKNKVGPVPTSETKK